MSHWIRWPRRLSIVISLLILALSAGADAAGARPRAGALGAGSGEVPEAAVGGGGLAGAERPSRPGRALPIPTASPIKDPLESPAAAEAPAGIDPLPVAPTQRFSDLETRWEDRRYALMRRDPIESAAQEARLLELLQVLDVQEVDRFAAAAVRESQALTWTDPRLALARAELAVALSRSLPAAHQALLTSRFAVDPWGIVGWGRAGVEMVVRSFSSERHLRPLLADLGVAGGVALFIGGAVFLLLAALRYGRYLLHDFHHLFPKRTARLQTTLLAALILSLPVALGLGPLPTALLWVAAFWMYMGRAEQLVAAAWLLALGLSPLAAGALADRTAWSGTTAELLDRIDRGGEFSRLPLLEERSRSATVTPEELFVLARAKKREGHWAEAARLYEDILARRSGWAPAVVNLGNVRFLEGDLARAEAHYRQAIELDPNLAAAWFNLSRLHYRQVAFVEGQQTREKAVELDPSLVERYGSGEHAVMDANRYLVDARLGDRDLAKVAVRPGEALRVRRQLALLLSPMLPPGLSPWLPLAAVVLLAATFRLRERLSPSTGCVRCGRSVCHRCDPETRNLRDCGQCLHVFGRRSRVDPAARVRKELAVRRYKARRRLALRVASIFLAAPVLSGRTLQGVVYLVIAFFYGALLGLGDGFVRRSFLGDGGSWRVAVVSLFFLGIYIQGLRAGLRDDG